VGRRSVRERMGEHDVFSGDYRGIALQERLTCWKLLKPVISSSAASDITFSMFRNCSCKFRIALMPNHPRFFTTTVPLSWEQELGSPVHVEKMLGQNNDTPYFLANAWCISNFGSDFPACQTESISASTPLAAQVASSKVTGLPSPQSSAVLPPKLGWMSRIVASDWRGMEMAVERAVWDRRRRRSAVATFIVVAG
jgi:hypothetical protein